MPLHLFIYFLQQLCEIGTKITPILQVPKRNFFFLRGSLEKLGLVADVTQLVDKTAGKPRTSDPHHTVSSHLLGADHRALHLSSTGPEFHTRLHWPRETLHSPASVSQVQSFRWTTVIGQFRCQRGSRPEWLCHNQADVMGEGWGLQRQGSHSQKIRAAGRQALVNYPFPPCLLGDSACLPHFPAI